MAFTRNNVSVFDTFQKAKITFLQNIHDYTAKREIDVNPLIDMCVVQHVIPLLRDAHEVRNLALLTTVKLSACSQKIAKHILEKKVLKHLGRGFECQSKDFRRDVLQIIKNISQYPELTPELMSQTVKLFSTSINDVDAFQRELVLIALTNVINYNHYNAAPVINLNMLPQISICMQLPVNVSLEATKLVKALSKKSSDMANIIIDNNILSRLADNLSNNNTKLIKQTMLCLIEIAKHSKDFAEKVMSTRVLGKTILYTSHCDMSVRKTAAMLIRELSKHSADLSKSMVRHGALAGLVDMISNRNHTVRLPAIMSLGYMAAQSCDIALTIIHSHGLQQLITALHNETDEPTLGVIVYTIEQLTRHSAQHVSYLADTNVFDKLLMIYLSSDSSSGVKSRCKSALQNTVSQCLSFNQVYHLLNKTPPEFLLSIVIKQLCKILPHNSKDKRLFVSTGGLKRVLSLKADPGTDLYDAIRKISFHFPHDLVSGTATEFNDSLLNKEKKCFCTQSSILTEVNTLDVLEGEISEEEIFGRNESQLLFVSDISEEDIVYDMTSPSSAGQYGYDNLSFG